MGSNERTGQPLSSREHARGVWVDLAAPSALEALILSDTFRFHPLSVDDAMAKIQFPKVESYDGYLYIVLHGIDFHEGDKINEKALKALVGAAVTLNKSKAKS